MEELKAFITNDFLKFFTRYSYLILNNHIFDIDDLSLTIKFTFHPLTLYIDEFEMIKDKISELDNDCRDNFKSRKYHLKGVEYGLNIIKSSILIEPNTGILYDMSGHIDIIKGYFLNDGAINVYTRFHSIAIEFIQRILKELNRLEILSLIDACFGNINQNIFSNLLLEFDPEIYHSLENVTDLNMLSWQDIYLMFHPKIKNDTDELYKNYLYYKARTYNHHQGLYQEITKLENVDYYSSHCKKRINNDFRDHKLFYLKNFNNNIDWYKVFTSLNKKEYFNIIMYLLDQYEIFLESTDDLLIEIDTFNILDIIKMLRKMGYSYKYKKSILIQYLISANYDMHPKMRLQVENMLKYFYNIKKYPGILACLANLDLLKWFRGYDQDSEIKNTRSTNYEDYPREAYISWISEYYHASLEIRHIMDQTINFIDKDWPAFGKSNFYESIDLYTVKHVKQYGH